MSNSAISLENRPNVPELEELSNPNFQRFGLIMFLLFNLSALGLSQPMVRNQLAELINSLVGSL